MNETYRLLRLARPHWRLLALSMILTFGTLTAGILLMAVSAYLISKATLAAGFASLALIVTAVRSLAISRAALRYSERYVTHLTTFRILTRLRGWFYTAVEPLAPARLQDRRSSDLMVRITADIGSLDDFYGRGIAAPTAGVLALAVACLVLGLLSPVLGLSLLPYISIAGVVLPLVERTASLRPAQAEAAHRGAVAGAATDHVQGEADLLTAGARGRFEEDAHRIDLRYAAAQHRLGVIQVVVATSSTLVTGLAVIGALALAIPYVGGNDIDGIYLALVPLTVAASFEAIQVLAGAWQRMAQSTAAGNRLFDLIDQPAAPRLALASRPAGRRLEFRSVTFAYPGGDGEVLKDLSFVLSHGNRLYLTGPSGAGKSTVLGLLLRFWAPQDGTIFLDGQPISDYDEEEVRAVFSVVPQNPYLFSGTVRDNLLVARGDASDQEIEEACKQARVHNVIGGLPSGYDSFVGENGLRLSGGERQRIAIARAILKDAPIVFLDEATANLDASTEAGVWESLNEWLRDRTALIVTHQASLIPAGAATLHLREPGPQRA